MNEKLSEFAHAQSERLQYTPDAGYLDKRQWHRLFICDELMRGRSKAHVKDDRWSFLASAFTMDYFSVWKWNIKDHLQVIPLLGLHFFDTPLLQIKGELYGVRASVLKELDTMTLNGVEYERKRIKLLVPCRPKKMPWADTSFYTKAWMYIGSHNWRDQIDAGYYFSRVNIYKPNREGKENYYHFTEHNKK